MSQDVDKDMTKVMIQKISRRKFNKTLVTSSALGTVLSTVAGVGLYKNFSDENVDKEIWFSAQGHNPKQYGIGWVSSENQQHSQSLTNFRGHGLCQNPVNAEHVVMFSRRPGNYGVRLNATTGEIDGTFQCAADRYMHGHGCFSADGKTLFSTESSIHSGQGKIALRDSQTLEMIGEFESYGIGPHEVKLMPDGHTLVVANGGLLTHPDSGRKVLNLDTMRSTLSYIDSRTGALISDHTVAESKASIRHLDVASDGTVAMALQVQRKAMDNNEPTALAAIHKQGQAIQVLHAPENLTLKLHDYMGSVAINNRSRLAAFTSPKGDLALFWHLDDLTLQGYHAFHDVCGLTVSQDNKYFVLSNSAGKIRQINTQTLEENIRKRMQFHNVSWDNHMLSITLASLRSVASTTSESSG